MNSPEPTATPFHDLDAYLALPRTSGLAMSPDGRRLVVSVGRLDPTSTRYVTSLWEVDPEGTRPARQVTRSEKGETSAAFAFDGSLFFISARPDPSAREQDKDNPACLWVLPADAGEARLVAKRAGGISSVTAAARANRFAVMSDTLPGSTTAQEEQTRRAARKERKVSAMLHETYPVRWWDHDLGPGQPRLFSGELGTGDPESPVQLLDRTPSPGRALDEASYELSADGDLLVTTWQIAEAGGQRQGLAAISDGVRLLADAVDMEFSVPRISPDSTQVVCLAEERSTAFRPPRASIQLIDVASGARTQVAAHWDASPTDLAWVPDGRAIVVASDERGSGPLFRVDLATANVARLTGVDRGTYTDPKVSPDGRYVYALRSAIDSPPVPVRLSLDATDQRPVFLPGPCEPRPDLPGTLTEVEAVAEDGTALRAWLVLPDSADADSPVPLLLWIHGGPVASWNAWSWRWNPWLAAARGYAVLLPDPALSTGYGHQMIARGWGRWGSEPYTDLLRLTDAALARPDLDPTRTAAMGGSFGGYMANWVAGHTDRFRAIVTHASLWALDQFGPTTDAAYYWRREMTPEMAQANSPHLFVDQIATPMLIIHGDRDYRVPIGEALRLWSELTTACAGPDGTSPHKFLYFPDEHHWVLSPQHSKVWYETVFAFLASTVLGQPWQVPDLLQ